MTEFTYQSSSHSYKYLFLDEFEPQYCKFFCKYYKEVPLLRGRCRRFCSFTGELLNRDSLVCKLHDNSFCVEDC